MNNNKKPLTNTSVLAQKIIATKRENMHLPPVSIANMLGTSPCYVLRVLKQEGFPPLKLVKEEIIEMKLASMNIRNIDIVRELRCSRSWVGIVLKQAGLQSQKNKKKGGYNGSANKQEKQ